MPLFTTEPVVAPEEIAPTVSVAAPKLILPPLIRQQLAAVGDQPFNHGLL
jgi:hypothetical protein